MSICIKIQISTTKSTGKQQEIYESKKPLEPIGIYKMIHEIDNRSKRRPTRECRILGFSSQWIEWWLTKKDCEDKKEAPTENDPNRKSKTWKSSNQHKKQMQDHEDVRFYENNDPRDF